MANIELVIKIPESQYKTLNAKTQKEVVAVIDNKTLIDAIKDGVPLPKDHGRLIDKDKLLDELEKTVKSVDDTNKHLLFWDRAVAFVHSSKPIIEADVAESEVEDETT